MKPIPCLLPPNDEDTIKQRNKLQKGEEQITEI